MKPVIDFKECLKDSPKFRASLEEAENDIELLETRLEKLVKLCSTMIETGKAFNNATRGFVTGVRDLATYFKNDNLASDDSKVSNSLTRFADVMSEMLKYFLILMDQANRSVCKNINNFIKTDIRKVKETKKYFEKISDDMDNALVRNSQTPKSKVQECEDANNSLIATRSVFAHTSLDYVYQINVLHLNKRCDILETMLSFMHAQNTFFHQGHDLFKDLEPYMKEVSSQVDELSTRASQERKEMDERHMLVQETEFALNSPFQPGIDGDNSKMEGYLFKRTTNAFKSWVRRWFSVQDNQLVYRKRSKDSMTIMEEDLRLCTVKPAFEIERRFCFEVVSPSRNHMLQADSDQLCQKWMSAIQEGVSKAYGVDCTVEDHTETLDNLDVTSSPDANSPQSVQQKPNRSKLRMEQLLSIPGNDRCCDCGSPDPRWTSINLGITLCIECSGIHRSFGVHMSKVRSIMLDAWEPELLKVMAELGNDVINRTYESNVNETKAVRATPECTRTIREMWIKSKYIEKAFASNLLGNKSSSEEKIRSWSVRKRTKHSPGRSAAKDENSCQSDSEEKAPTSDLMKAVLSVTTGSKASCDGNGPSAANTDVIIFGSDITLPDLNKSLDLESSEDSSTEAEDTRSTTSWEDMSKLDPNMLLYKAAQARNLPVMLDALAHGGNINWVNEDDGGKTPLMKAVETGSLAACEFLLLNGAKLDKKDNNGNTPLHHATILGHTGLVCQFLKRGANRHALDNKGNDALKIAMNTCNADIVTLLRLARLNEEMWADGDETCNDVFRDFSNMASHNPEKLKRK